MEITEEAFDHKLAKFDESDVSRNDFLRCIMSQYREKVEQCKKLEKDLEMEKVAHVSCFDDWKEAEAVVKTQRKRDAYKPFVMVLVDGDGYMFDPTLLCSGSDGGAKAFRRLRTQVLNALQLPDEMTCVIKVFYSRKRWLTFYVNGSKITSEYILESFVEGFRTASEHADVFEVGSQKDAADRRIREYYDVHKTQARCQKIVIGGIHDRGYAGHLRYDQIDSFVWSRLHLLYLKSVTHTDYDQLGLPYFYSDDVFLPDSDPAFEVKLQRPSGSPNASNAMRAENSAVTRVVKGAGWANAVLTGSTSETRRPVIVGQSSDDTIQGPKKPIYFNRYDERVDKDIFPIENLPFGKFCYEYFLGHRCRLQPCSFDHRVLSEGQRNMLRVRARNNPCNSMDDCRDPGCYYGHQCPRGKDCNGSAGCRFKKQHNKDTDIVRTIKV